MDELLQEFIAETRETLAALASEIVAWEADPADRARLDAIFRFVHTVKGSCGFLDLPRLARLSHQAEDALAAVRDGRRGADGVLVDAVLAVVDRIGELTEMIDAGEDIGTDGDELLIAALNDGPAPDVTDPPAAAAGAPVATAEPKAPTKAAQRSVRLPVELLDRMMSGMSDMVLARNELARKLRDGDADPVADAALERLSVIVADMRDTVGRTRMQTIEALFAAIPRMVRDTAVQLGKQVNVVIAGGDVEIDREMIEALRDPLVHILRNAVDHGIEPPAVRAAAGKPAAGTLAISARQSGNTIVIEVADDGAGIDTARLVAKYAAAHGRAPAELARLSEQERLDLIFEPGLSSRDEVTQVSGRGVGMDVVRANVEQVGGRIELANDPGGGLVIAIHVPLTLSILPTIVVSAGGQRFAVARQSVDEIVTIDGNGIRVDPLGDGRVATVRGERMALVDLPALLGLAAVPSGGRAMLAIMAVPGGSFALAVDSVIDSEELVVKPASPAVMGCGLFAGQTLPDTGVPMLVLDAAGIACARGIAFARRNAVEEAPPASPAAGLECLLFIDSDGVRRALPLGAVDRLEEVDRRAVGFVGGRMRLTTERATVPVIARAPLDDARVRLVRLRSDDVELAYAVAETVEIAALGGNWAEAPAAEGLLGIAVHDGMPVEIVDPRALLAPADAGAGRAGRPVCVLAGAGQQWMAGFLAPVLERAGYRVSVTPPAGEEAVVLAMAGDEVTVPAGGRIVRLSERPGPEGVFRYDRAAVLAAVGAGR